MAHVLPYHQIRLTPKGSRHQWLHFKKPKGHFKLKIHQSSWDRQGGQEEVTNAYKALKRWKALMSVNDDDDKYNNTLLNIS